jgi:hypothetical protein
MSKMSELDLDRQQVERVTGADYSQYITPVSGLQYYVAMIDFGRGQRRPNGFGADVSPEYTRRQIVEEVRDDIARGRSIVHVKFIDGNSIEDVTHEIVAEALASTEPQDIPGFEGVRQQLADLKIDHQRDLIKHGAI